MQSGFETADVAPWLGRLALASEGRGCDEQLLDQGLQGAVREVEPEEGGRVGLVVIAVVVVRTAGIKSRDQRAVPVDLADIFDAGGGLHQREVSVLEDGGLPERGDGFEGWRGEDRVAGVEDEGVGEAEFFAEPGYAFGLGDLEVVDCEDHF